MVGGLVAFGVHKMSQKDADRIEQHTGIPPEEMEDDELEKAMNELDIPVQTVDASDQEVGGAPPPDPGAPAAGAPAAPAETSPLDEIARLAELRDKGILTDEEFNAKKTELLGRM